MTSVNRIANGAGETVGWYVLNDEKTEALAEFKTVQEACAYEALLKVKDYTITLQDDTGKTVVLYCLGDCVQEAINMGFTVDKACEEIESNAADKAIYNGDIGRNHWIIAKSI